MGDLSQHFSRSEFACGCGCGFGLQPGDVDPVLVGLLEDIRATVGGPLRLTSGCRCEAHNAAVGGVPGSVHTLGQAADIQVEGGRHRRQVLDAAIRHQAGGVGVARSFIHVDVHHGSIKPRPSAWSY
jgi:uncharacterized protein YcbK (DUF882 family)